MIFVFPEPRGNGFSMLSPQQPLLSPQLFLLLRLQLLKTVTGFHSILLLVSCTLDGPPNTFFSGGGLQDCAPQSRTDFFCRAAGIADNVFFNYFFEKTKKNTFEGHGICSFEWSDELHIFFIFAPKPTKLLAKNNVLKNSATVISLICI